MTRGTWQGSGTWQTSGPDVGALVAIGAIAVVVVAVAEFILSIIVWLAIATGVVLVLAVTGLIWWKIQVEPKRAIAIRAAFAREEAIARAEATAVAATATPQVSAGTKPAIENHYHVHHHYAASPEPARVIPGKLLP